MKRLRVSSLGIACGLATLALSSCNLRRAHLLQGGAAGAGGSPGSVAVEVVPPAPSGLSPTVVELSLAGLPYVALHPAPRTLLTGRVTLGVSGPPLGGVRVKETQHAPSPAWLPASGEGITDASGAFQLPRLEGASIDLELVPPAPRPPLLLTAVPNGPLGTLALPSDAQLVTVKSTLTTATVPIVGANVVAVSNGRAVSAVVQTDSTGAFSFLLPAGASVELLVDPNLTSPTSPAPLPSFRLDERGLGTALPATIDVGQLPPPATLSGQVVDATGAPVAGATVLARSADAVPWTLLASAQTSASGSFSLPLRNGGYVLTAAGSPTSTAGISAPVSLTVGAQNHAELVCPLKISTTLSLSSDAGAPVPGAAITALSTTAGAGAGSVPSTAGESLRAAPTGVAGEYRLLAPAGSYLLAFSPPDSSLPIGLADLTISPGAGPLSVALPPAALVQGRVANSNEVGVAGALINVHALVEGHKLIVGTGQTDAQGKFAVLVPGVLPPMSAP